MPGRVSSKAMISFELTFHDPFHSLNSTASPCRNAPVTYFSSLPAPTVFNVHSDNSARLLYYHAHDSFVFWSSGSWPHFVLPTSPLSNITIYCLHGFTVADLRNCFLTMKFVHGLSLLSGFDPCLFHDHKRSPQTKHSSRLSASLHGRFIVCKHHARFTHRPA